MAFPTQDDIQDINADLPDDVSNHPPPLPPRKPSTTSEMLSEEQHRNGKSNIRLQESVDLITFPNDDTDTHKSVASWDVFTGNSFDNVISECPLLNLIGNCDTDQTHSGIHSGLETNMSDRLDKFFNSDLFKQSPDLDSEIRPILYTPDFSTCSRDIDAVQSANSVDLPPLPGERLQNQSLSFDVKDSTESTTLLTNPPTYSSKLIPMENHSDSANSKRSCVVLNSYFRENSIYSLDDVNPTTKVETIQSSDTESNDQDDIWYNLKPRRQDVYLTKLREQEQELNQKEQLQKGISSNEAPGLSNIYHPKFSSQRSVSESDIYDFEDFEDEMKGLNYTAELNLIERDNHDIKKCGSIDNINSRTRRDRSSTIKKHDMRASSSFEDIKSKAAKLRGKICKSDKDSYGRTSQKLSIKVDARVELSCPCERACRRVQSLVTTQGGYMWVSFKQCSLVSLYSNRHKKVYTVDVRGCVDSMALSASNVLYVSCPTQKKILMLPSNLQMTVLRSFLNLYPRGVAVSPDNGKLVVCMASQTVGNVMEGPSKNSCLMQFKGETTNEKGTILNKGNHFGYPVKVTINMDGFILVSDFGLRCLFVLDKGGNMLRTFSTLGGGNLWHVHALTSNPVSSFYVVQGGGGTLSIIRLGEYLGSFEEKSTSTKDEPLLKQKVETASMNTEGQIVLASGNIITHVSLVN